MRAKIVGRRTRFRRGSWVQWYATLTDPETGRVLWSDDCSDLAELADDAREIAGAFTIVAAKGQQFRSWSDICEEAGRDL